MKNNSNQTLLVMILAAAFTATSMLSASQPLTVNVAVNVFIPLLIHIFCRLVFFERLKLATLMTLRILILLALFNILNRQLYVNIVIAFLGFNILEATFTDILRYKKYFNGITGIVLALSCFFLRGTWIDLTNVSQFGFFSKYMHIYEFHAPTFWGTIAWIIAYTLWNWIFVTNEFSPAVAKLHVAILASPILGALLTGNPNMWLPFRASSLSFGGCFQIAEKEYVETRLKSDKWTAFVQGTQKQSVQLVLMVINLALIIFSVVAK